MVTGSLCVGALIPGSPGAIAAALENVGSGAAPAQQMSQAWQVMQLPSWQGAAGEAWRAFTPKEHGHLAVAPAAFNRAAATMLRYEGAFRAARAEAQAAIHPTWLTVRYGQGQGCQSLPGKPHRPCRPPRSSATK
ncbi:putative T7SS-secreted protein [Leucobacter sp. HY1910]